MPADRLPHRLLLLLALAATAPCQQLPSTLPTGITLPVALAHTLRAGSTPIGTAVRARTTQRIPLPGNTHLRRGADLLGTVTASTTHPDTLTLRFTTLRDHGRTLPLTAQTLAIAGFPALSTLSIPSNGSADRGNSNPANWTTTQVGGDQVVRTQWTGPVINTSTETVGFADFHGIYANPRTPGGLPRALGPFSAGSTGLFGYNPDCHLLTNTVTCATSSLSLRAGDILLLETLPQPNRPNPTPSNPYTAPMPTPAAPEQDPRVYFAAERTFLAWIRTGLGLMGVGFAVSRFSLFLRELDPSRLPTHAGSLPRGSGIALVLLGVLVNLSATVRHVQLVRDLRSGHYQPGRLSTQAIALAIILALGGLSMALYLTLVR